MAERAPVFAYEFADTNAPGMPSFFPGFDPGASHTGELPFLFDVDNHPIDMTGQHVPLTPDQLALAATMVKYWTQFAHTGDPNSTGTPHWPRCNSDAVPLSVQILGSGPNGIEPRNDASAAHHCDFWDAFAE